MIVVNVKIRPAGNVRGRRISARVAGIRSASGRNLAISAPWDHAKDFLGNADAIVAEIRDKLNPFLSIVGGGESGPGKRVYLLDLVDAK
jgi:hypothetical protein